jgi:hypothetical protein
MSEALVSKGNPTFSGLATELQRLLDDYASKGFHLAGSISISNRKNLESEVEGMKKQTRDKRSAFYNNMNELLFDKSNEWFAFFKVLS